MLPHFGNLLKENRSRNTPHSMSALLEASSLLLLRAISAMKAAVIMMRHRIIELARTTGCFISTTSVN